MKINFGKDNFQKAFDIVFDRVMTDIKPFIREVQEGKMPYYNNQRRGYINQPTNNLMTLVGKRLLYEDNPENINVRKDASFIEYLQLIINNLQDLKNMPVDIIDEYLKD